MKNKDLSVEFLYCISYIFNDFSENELDTETNTETNTITEGHSECQSDCDSDCKSDYSDENDKEYIPLFNTIDILNKICIYPSDINRQLLSIKLIEFNNLIQSQLCKYCFENSIPNLYYYKSDDDNYYYYNIKKDIINKSDINKNDKNYDENINKINFMIKNILEYVTINLCNSKIDQKIVIKLIIYILDKLIIDITEQSIEYIKNGQNNISYRVWNIINYFHHLNYIEFENKIVECIDYKKDLNKEMIYYLQK